jgi:hypothetical protein
VVEATAILFRVDALRRRNSSLADEFGDLRSNEAGMRPPCLHPVVHLELHTGNLARASDFYTRMFG